MIKLTLAEKPAQLTNELVAELTAEFKATEKAVWKRSFIVKAVLAMSFSKCVYSEIKLVEEGKYMEIDHFFCKKEYPDRVVEWGNLMASSKACNGKKSDWDVGKEPIINPFVDEPREHLYIHNFKYFPRNGSNLGRCTIKCTGINDRKKFFNKRAKVGYRVSGILDDLGRELKRLQTNSTNSQEDLFVFRSKIKQLFEEGERKEEYAALVSTVILEEDETPKLIEFLQQNNLWDSEFDELIAELEFCQLKK